MAVCQLLRTDGLPARETRVIRSELKQIARRMFGVRAIPTETATHQLAAFATALVLPGSVRRIVLQQVSVRRCVSRWLVDMHHPAAQQPHRRKSVSFRCSRLWSAFNCSGSNSGVGSMAAERARLGRSLQNVAPECDSRHDAPHTAEAVHGTADLLPSERVARIVRHSLVTCPEPQGEGEEEPADSRTRLIPGSVQTAVPLRSIRGIRALGLALLLIFTTNSHPTSPGSAERSNP